MLPIAALGVFKNWKLIGAGIGIILLLLGIWIGYSHYQGILLKVEELTKANEHVKMITEIQASQIGQQRNALGEWKKSQEDLIKHVHELSRVATEARKETGRLHDLFAKHNFSELATKKPGLIERRVNTGTVDVFRMLQCETGDQSSCPSNRKAGQKASTSEPGPH